MKCTNCGAEWDLDAEDRYYYRIGGMIVSEKLVKCRKCIPETISFAARPFSRVLPVPSFGLDAMFSPRMEDIFVEIHPVPDEDRR